MNANAGRSRVTGVVRVVAAVWLIASASFTLADPARGVAMQGLPMGVLLPLAGLDFAVGAFLLVGFMSRIGGLLLVGLGVWQTASFGLALGPPLLALVGAYLALRGGGGWAMDIYVQKMQDRVRQRAASE